MEAADRDPEVNLLGPPFIRFSLADAPFPVKGFQLLALVARARRGRVARETAAALLWDQVDRRTASANLRQLLRRIRCAMAGREPLVDADARTIALGPGADAIDLVRFERLADSELLDEQVSAVLIVRGDLLAAAPEGGDEFRHWLTRERTAVRERILTLGEAVLRDLTRAGRARAGDLVAVGERMLALAPEREETLRALINAFARIGDLGRAYRLQAELAEMTGREHDTWAIADAARPRRLAPHPAREPETAASGRFFPPDPTARPRLALLAPTDPEGVGNPALVRALIEDVADDLSRFRTFTVLAPHSSFQIDHDSGLPRVDGCFRIDYSVSARVRPGTGGAVLSLRMTRLPGADILWAADYAIGAGDLARTFGQLSQRIASSLADGLERAIQTGVKGSVDAAAYLTCLQADTIQRACDLPSIRRARRLYLKALRQDRRYAAAQARIAQTYYLEWLILGGDDPVLLHEGLTAADAAIALDPGGALGHTMRAAISLYRRDFETAAVTFAEAEALHPNSADVLVQHADALIYMGGADDARARFDRALDLNPQPPDRYWWVGASIALKQRDYAGMIELCGRMANDEPVLRLLAVAHAYRGDIAVARTYAHRVREVYPGIDAAAMVRRVPFSSSDDVRHFVAGLHLAGIA